MTEARTTTIKVPIMARIEGEGALELNIEKGQISELNLRIFEPPRLFEKFLENRHYDEVPDIVARICGICPVAYQMSAVHAIEQAFAVELDPWIRKMRRVLYCGEWIQSHALHIHLLAAPDFLGYNNAIELAQDHPEPVRRGMKLQALGNRIMGLFGGRSVHPVGVCVGGFHHAPNNTDVAQLREDLQAAIADAKALLDWCTGLTLPADDQAFTSVALHHPDEYPMNEGNIISSAGLDIAAADYQQHFKEHQVAHSTALHATLHGAPYLVGPLARVNLNRDHLPVIIQDDLKALDINFPSNNMFHSIIARAIEIYYALYEAARLLTDYQPPENTKAVIIPSAASGTSCTEAPRGILWHRYEIDQAGHVTLADIVPPTSQNQARIEQDLRHSLEAFGLDHDDAALRLHSEMVIRNYDPCISCSTHFLDLTVTRR